MATYFPANALVVDSVTKTVGAAGDFATIQGAVDWFSGKIAVNECVIDVDNGSYDEEVIVRDIVTGGRDGSLILQGDTRALVGITYVDGVMANPQGIANGGTFNAANTCTLATNAGRDQITVSGGTVDPDFDAAGIVNGDDILVYADDGNIYEREVNSISPGGAGNNVIEITVALPVGATLGNDGTAVCLLPNRRIERTTAGICLRSNIIGFRVQGFYLVTSTGANCYGLYVPSGDTRIYSLVTRAEDRGISVIAPGAVSSWTYSESLWDSTSGMFVGFGGVANFYNGNLVLVGCTRGYHVSLGGIAQLRRATAVNCTEGFYIEEQSYADTITWGTARQNTTGYYAADGAFLKAVSTNAYNNGNGADYNPVPGAIPGYGNGNGDANIYAS